MYPEPGPLPDCHGCKLVLEQGDHISACGETSNALWQICWVSGLPPHVYRGVTQSSALHKLQAYGPSLPVVHL